MEKVDLGKELLRFLYEEVRINSENSQKIRNWCITVWMASLAAIAYGKLELNPFQMNVFPFVPILLFWLLDAFQNTFASLNTGLAMKLEGHLANNTIDQVEIIDLYYHHAYSKYKFIDKVKVLNGVLLLKKR